MLMKKWNHDIDGEIIDEKLPWEWEIFTFFYILSSQIPKIENDID